MEVGSFNLGDVVLESGGVLPAAQIGYRHYGVLDDTRANCILLPTYYGGTHDSYAPLIGPGKALDPSKWFIVIADMFGNGVSTSPSNWQGQHPYPLVSILDNVKAQERLLREEFGVSKLALAAGWSMGGMQALHWGMHRPEMVERIFSWCGTARCWPMNQLFLSGLRSTLLTDMSSAKLTGARAFGHNYVAWAYSDVFFREEKWRGMGYASAEDLIRAWEDDHAAVYWADLIAMLDTWYDARHLMSDGQIDFREALSRITARTWFLTCDTDRYFLVAEAALEAGGIADATAEIMHSPFGHAAGAPGRFPAESDLIDRALARALAT